MASGGESSGALEKPRAIRTLLCLYGSSGDISTAELLDQIGGSRTTGLTRLDEFRELGLVEKKAGENRTLYCLTEDGKEVAEYLVNAVSCIDKLLEETNNE